MERPSPFRVALCMVYSMELGVMAFSVPQAGSYPGGVVNETE